MSEEEAVLAEHSVPLSFIEQFVANEQAMARTDNRLNAILRTASVGTVVSRAGWGARPPRASSSLSSPKGSTAHWEGPRMGTFGHDTCASRVRGIQNFHMNVRGWSDIAYSSIVCPHGVTYECRWWRRRTAANGTNAGNDRSYAHCLLIGEGDPFTIDAKRGLRDVFDRAQREGGAGHEKWVHRDWKATACPGNEITNFVRGGLQVDGAPTPPPAPAPPSPTPPSPPSDWFEELIMELPVIDFRPAERGQYVRHHLVDNIQGLLEGAQHGPSNPGGIDGVGGGGTLRAVRAFQEMKGLGVDGVVGRNTWRALVTH